MILFSGLTLLQLEKLVLKCRELISRLKPLVIHRTNFLSTWKQDHLLTIDDIKRYGASEKIKQVCEILRRNVPSSVNTKTAIAARNYLIFMICLGNAARSSNIMNITLHDIQKSDMYNEYNAKAIRSNEYKTSLLYGEKLLLLPMDIFDQLENYIKNMRSLLLEDEDKEAHERYLFTTCRKNKMTASAISNALSSTLSVGIGSNTEKWYVKCFVVKIIT